MQVLVLGDAGVGKSCLIAAVSANQVCSRGGYQPSISPDVTCITSSSDAGSTTIRLWDYPGGERFMNVRGRCDVGRQFACCVLVYDCTSQRSVEHLESWYDEYLQFAHTGGDGTAPRVILVGTKADLPPNTVVHEAAQKLAARLAIYPPPPSGPTHRVCVASMKCSALTLSGIHDVASALFALEQRRDPVVPWLLRWPSLPSPIEADLVESGNPFPVLRAFVAVEHATVADRGLPGVHHTGSGIVLVTCGIPSDPTYPIGADVCVLVVRLRFASVAVTHVSTWAQKMTSEACLLCPAASLSLCVIGVPSTDYTIETRDAAVRAAAECGASFFVCSETTTTDDVWHHVAVSTLDKRRSTVLMRSLWTTDQPLPHASPPPPPERQSDADAPVTKPTIDAAAVERAHKHATSMMESRAASDPLLLAMNRRVLEAELACERRVAQVTAQLQVETEARLAAESKAAQREEALQDQIQDLRAELKLIWQQLDRRS